MGKILLLLYTFGIAIYLNTPILPADNDYVVEVEEVLIHKEIKQDEQVYFDIINNAMKEAQYKLDEVNKIENKELWFKEYKQLTIEYASIIDPPTTIYDCYTEEEIYLIQRVVETECYDQDFESKCNVASVILNRVNAGGEFGDTIEEVITKENQFAYWREVITENAILAVEYAYQIKDTTDGCIAFRSDKSPKEWYGWEYVFTDSAGHAFYREKEGE